MFDWLKCLLGDHDWTCDADKGVPPPDLDTETVQRDFYRYARPWCNRCRSYMQPRKDLHHSVEWDATVKYRP